MKKISRILALALALILALSLAACGNGGAESSQPAEPSESQPAEPSQAEPSEAQPSQSEPAADDGKTYLIGICQVAAHPALDLATQGFKDALTEALGDKVTFDQQDAAGEFNNCVTIMDGFVSENVDLILANATDPLTAAASATDTIPILGTSITEYGSALGIDDWSGTSGRNISGTSDLAPLDGQADMIVELFPEAKTVGLLFHTSEVNSVYQVNAVKGYLDAKGITAKLYGYSDANDMPSVCQTACDECDVLYVPTDNFMAANTETVANIVLPAGKPVIAGEEGICSGCGVATLTISYYNIGYAAGEMAVKILTEGADISTMPVGYDPNVVKKYNPEICQQLNVTVPADYEAIG